MILLFLNSLGTGEVLLILFVVLILFGSKGIPDVVKNLGRGMNEIRNASNEIKRDIQKSALEMRKDLELDKPFEEIKDIGKMIEADSEQKKDTDSKTNNEQTDKSA